MGQITKQIKGKIIFKHGTEADWNLSNYKPDKGEQVLYDPDGNYSYTRVKYGDGERIVAELPFGGATFDDLVEANKIFATNIVVESDHKSETAFEVSKGQTKLVDLYAEKGEFAIPLLEDETWGFYTFYYPEDGEVGYHPATWQNRIAIPKIHQYPSDVFISVKEGYKFNIAYLSSSVPSNDTFIEGISWQTEAITIKTGTYFSLVLAKTDNSVITLEEAENISVSKYTSIKDIYEAVNNEYVSDIVTRNKDIEHIIQACCNYGRTGERYKKCLSMLTATDIHGDANVLKNMVDYLNRMESIDCGISLGDMQVMVYGDNDGTWYTDVVNQSNKDFYTVLGNHDLGVWNGYEGNGTAEQAFNKFIQPTLGKIGISDLTTPYYSKTFDDYKTVVIVLTTYDTPNDTDTDGEFIIPRDNEMFSQAQINWFIQTLNSIPSEYHIVVAMHSIGFEHIVNESNFTQKNNTYNLEMVYPYGYCTIIPDIINAWINGNTLSTEYPPAYYDDFLPTLTANCDFSARGEGIFACYLVGHNHSDMIMECAKYEEQKIVSLVSSSGTSRCVERADLPRINGTKTEDALTVFSVDTQHRLIKLVRVGSNITNELVDRTFTAISY